MSEHDIPAGRLTAEYSRNPPGEPLPADALAAVVFGSDTRTAPDPRDIHVNLQPLIGAGLREIWRGSAPVRRGLNGSIRFAEDGDWLAGMIEFDEDEFGGVAQTAEAAYRQILQFHAESEIGHLLRTWAFLGGINVGSNDAERYKLFCLGRAQAFSAYARNVTGKQFPAATAVGRQDARRTLQICWLAGRNPGQSIENPRQVSAYRYPRQYGPASPSFSRAMLVNNRVLLVSGTASIVGHLSRHPGDVRAQLDETLANIDALLIQASTVTGASVSSIGPGSLLKVYVRDAEAAEIVETRLRQVLDPDVTLLVLAADICREELALEIEAVVAAPVPA